MSKKAIHSSCEHCEKRHLGIFCAPSPTSLNLLDTNKVSRVFKAGEYLFHEGDVSEGIYCVQSGAVKLESESEEGNVHLLHVVESGGVLGYKAILDGDRFHCSARAMQETAICFISKKVFHHLLETDPKIAIAAIRKLSSEVHGLESRLCNATDLSAGERVAEALLMLKDRSADRNWRRKELAEWAGTTEETVIRTLTTLKDEGIVESDGRKITILDRKRLLARAKILV